jgi:hypothetical protein
MRGCEDAGLQVTGGMGVAAAENGSGEALDELEGSDDAEEEEDGEGEGEGEDDGDSSADSEAGEWVKVGSDMPSQVRVQAGGRGGPGATLQSAY